MAAVLKTVGCNSPVGSNPTFSASVGKRLEGLLPFAVNGIAATETM